MVNQTLKKKKDYTSAIESIKSNLEFLMTILTIKLNTFFDILFIFSSKMKLKELKNFKKLLKIITN